LDALSVGFGVAGDSGLTGCFLLLAGAAKVRPVLGYFEFFAQLGDAIAILSQEHGFTAIGTQRDKALEVAVITIAGVDQFATVTHGFC
jgi:hypothetical protein